MQGTRGRAYKFRRPNDPHAFVLPGDPTEPSGGGNFGAAAALRAKLQGRAAPAASAAPKQETVVLPQVDAKGRAMPGAFGREAAGAGQSLLIIRKTPVVGCLAFLEI